MPTEIEESAAKPKVALFIGLDTPRLIKYLPELEQEIEKGDINRQIIRQASSSIKMQDISDEPVDVVSIYSHGNSWVIKPDDSKKLKTAKSSLIEDTTLTVNGLIKIQSKKHNRHFDILGCYQGALIQDIERNLNKFEVGTTFAIHASAQYSTSSDTGNPILLNQLKQYSAGETNQAKLYGQYSKQTAETLFFVKIVKGLDNKNEMIAFKSIAPKYANDAYNLEEFGKREGIYQLSNKEHQHANLITIAGANHPEYHALHETIATKRSITPFSANYLQQTLELDKSRRVVRGDNPEQAKDYRNSNRIKETLAETLLQKYKDIPDAVAKSYKNILIVKDESLHTDGWKFYRGGIIDSAIVHNQTISGRHPLVWALEENIQIDKKYPIVWAIENNQIIESEPAMQWAFKSSKKIEGKSLIEYAAASGTKVGEKIIDFAMVHNQNIEDKHPIVWAIEKNIKIGEKPSLLWAIENNKMIESEPALEWAIKRNQKIDGQSPFEFAIENKKKFGEKLAIEWALDNDINFGNQPVLEWALVKNIKAGDLSVLEYAVTNNTAIAGQPALDWAIDHHRTNGFSEELTSSSYVLHYINEEDGKPYTEEIPIGFPIMKMASNAIHKEATIDGIQVDDWLENRRALFTQHMIFDQTPVEYAIEHDRSIKGFNTVGLPQVYNIEAIERAVENNDINGIEASLRIDPNKTYEYGLTPLAYARIMNKPQSVRALLALGADPIAPDAYMNTELSNAVASGRAEIVRALLESPNINTLNNPGGSDLLLRALNADTVEILLNHKANPNIPSTDGSNSLDWAVTTVNLGVAEALLKGGANPNIPNKHGIALLHNAILRNQTDIVSALLEAGANPHEAAKYMYMPNNEAFETPIGLAAQQKNAKIISLLADKSVDLNKPGSDGKTPLSSSLSLLDREYRDKELNAIVDVVKTLLDRGANPNALNEDGSSALAMLKLNGEKSETKTKVFDLLLNAGAHFGISSIVGAELLQSAVKNYDTALVKKLLTHKANPNIKDEEGNSSLSIAVSMCKDSYDPSGELIKLLIEHGADLNTQDKNRVSLMQTAVSFNYPHIMNLLLESGANPNLRDKEGNSPLSYLVDEALKTVSYSPVFKDKIVELQGFLHHRFTDPNILGSGDVSPIESILNGKVISDSDQYNKNQLLKTLIDHPNSNPNILDKKGVSMLSNAIKIGNSEFVNTLLTKADVSLPDSDGTTPLQHAIKQNRPDLVKKLLGNGANPMSLGKNGELPLKTTIDALLSNKRLFINGYNARDNYIEIIEKLIIRTDPDQCSNLLHYIIKSKDEKLIDILIKHSDNLDVKDSNGKTALQNAMENKDTALVKKLVSQGSILNKQISEISETPRIERTSAIDSALLEIKNALVIHAQEPSGRQNIARSESKDGPNR